MRFKGLPHHGPALTLMPHEVVSALVSDDDLARQALAFDVRHIVTFVTDNRDEQIEALNALINAAEGDRLVGDDFWDSGKDCGCAIGTICHAIGVNPNQRMPGDHPRVVLASYTHFDEQPTEPAYWSDAIRLASATLLANDDRPERYLFVEQMLYSNTASNQVFDDLVDRGGRAWCVRPGQAAQNVHADRARTLLAEVAHQLLDEVLATPERPLTPPSAFVME